MWSRTAVRATAHALAQTRPRAAAHALTPLTHMHPGASCRTHVRGFADGGAPAASPHRQAASSQEHSEQQQQQREREAEEAEEAQEDWFADARPPKTPKRKANATSRSANGAAHASTQAATAAAAASTASPASAAPSSLPLPAPRHVSVPIDDFLSLPASLPTFDVRAPVEFAGGHIPGAVSLPIFDDEQRAQIGTTYKKVSKQKAIVLGLELFGPRMPALLQQAQRIAQAAGDPTVRLHCARGGMRSQAMQWLLELGGLKVHLLRGGYKAYRGSVHARFLQPLRRPLRVLGGLTGSGKTRVLTALAARGSRVLDLEALAGHKGSSFGNIGLPPQPTREMFENELAATMRQLDEAILAEEAAAGETAAQQAHSSLPTPPSLPSPSSDCVWVEDESRMIGSLPVPPGLFEQMGLAPLVVLEVPLALRIRQLADEYCKHDPDLLRAAIERITRKLGTERAREALQAIDRGDMERMVTIALSYYDKAYSWGLAAHVARVPTIKVVSHSADADVNADLIMQAMKEQQWTVPTPPVIHEEHARAIAAAAERALTSKQRAAS